MGKRLIGRKQRYLHRLWYAVSMVMVIGVGLASRRQPGLFPTFLAEYPGDALWALMVYCGLGCLWPQLKPLPRAVSALLLSYGVELSQLLHTDWLDRFRGKTLGHLMLGQGFQWADLVAYTLGVLVGFLGEKVICWVITQRVHRNAPSPGEQRHQ